MTTRLKKKLDELGVNINSRKANENFCLVRDEKGRRRLHGAFTGGFSAGYFNTVGSKEGWTPSTFVSSRNDRAKKAAARPEDFMDEEDLQDLKEGRNLVDTTEQMDLLGGTQAELLGKADDDSEKDPITRTLEASLVPAPKDSVGARILKKMGWRLGQGIGPRISLKQRKLQDAMAYDATTGTKFLGRTLDIPDDDEEANKHKYAPRDTPVLVVKRKDNYHGLGYVPGMSLNESLGDNAASGSNSGPKLAGGFGLGALNDADEDDLDVYDSNPTSSRNRVAYDIAAGEDDDTVVIGRRGDKQKAPQKAAATASQYFRDGSKVLAGFVLSDEPVVEEKWFPVPEVPPGWKPDPRRVWAADKENRQQPAPPPKGLSHEEWKRSKMSADQRGVILGETPLPAAPRSVFDYMSQKDKERIKSITSGLKSGASTASSKPAGPSISVTKLEPHVAQAALNGFQPFTNNPAQQARYTAYLRWQANPDGPSPPLERLRDQSIDDYNRELADYAKSASLFKPISGAMAGRFTSAAVLDLGPKINEGLHIPTQEEIAAKEAERKKEEEDKISPKEHAAKLGMYGHLTRETKPWQPAKLLCKRFGVKDPNSEPEVPEASASSSAAAAAAPSFTHPEQSFSAGTADVTAPVQSTSGPRDLNNIGLGEDDTQGQDTLTYERPSMDIFKAIFASDDEDSGDEGGKEKGDDDDDDDPSMSIVPPPNVTKESGTGFISATTILNDEPVDPETFKPKFIPREGQAKKSKDDEKSKAKKDKKDKKKKDKKSVLVSFAMDEDGGDDSLEIKQSKDRPTKKRKEQKQSEDGDDHGMWTAPAATSVAPPVEPAPPPAKADVVATTNEAGPKGRKRAIDFM
ncbi:DUF1604-domain-containing protein [Agrocybe pediades]|nr:DUF1604-domain-containing protein [Agrocybe pediades]